MNNELLRINAEDPWDYNVTASIGVYAAVPDAESGMDEFMTRADREMYADKTRRKREQRV